jgi:hypothetical protein
MMQQSHDERRMNMNTQLPEKINTFFENCKKNDVHPIPKDPHFNNLYLIQSVDMDGNVTNEKFGFNELTGLGIRNICWWGGFKAMIYSEDGSFAKLSNTYDNPHSDDSFSPIYYDSSTGMSTQYYKFKTVMEFDYNYSDATSDVEITKIGLHVYNGSDYIEYAKSLIYDVNGNVTSFTKHPNEKILLTVWLGASMNVGSIVNTAWNNGNYLLISPLFILRYAAGCRSYGDYDRALNMRFGMRTYRYSNMSEADCIKYLRPFDPKTDPQCTKESDQEYTYVECLMKYAKTELVSTNSVIYEKNWASKYIISDYYNKLNKSSFEFMVDANGGFSLPTPEEIIVDECMTNNNDSTFTDTLYSFPSSNSSVVGNWYYHSRLQLAQFNCTSIEIYNHKTKTWDQEAFDQDRNFLYEDTLIASLWWPVIVNGETEDRYVFVNSKAGTYPMTKIVTNSLHVWATDTFWDQSTWVEVNKNNLGSLGTKRYFIKSDINDYPVPYYDYTPLQITGLPASYTIPKTFEIEGDFGNARKVLPNPQCNCIIGYGQIVYPDNPSNVVTYNITNYGDDIINGNTSGSYTSDGNRGTVSIFRLTENGDKLIIAKRASSTNANNNYAAGCYRVYTISNNSAVAPTYEDIQVPYTNQLYNVQTYHSFTDKGFVVANHNEDQEVAIINLYGSNGVETEIIPGMWGYALNRTTNCVYLNIEDMSSLTFDVYNMSTKSVVKSFTLSGNYVMNGIMGWKNHVYVRVYDNTLQLYRVLYHNINEDSDTFVDVNISLFNQTSAECTMNREPGGIYDNSFSSCDEAFFIYKPDISSDQEAYRDFLLILDNDPTICRDLKAEHGWTSSGSGFLRSNGMFSRNTDGSFVGLEVVEYNNMNSSPESRYPLSSSNKQCSNYMIDIGRLYDHNYLNKTKVGNYTWNPPSTSTIVNKNSYVIYKNYRVYQSGDDIKFVPLAYSRFHRITGNTISIQTINNPKRIAPQDEVRIRITR